MIRFMVGAIRPNVSVLARATVLGLACALVLASAGCKRSTPPGVEEADARHVVVRVQGKDQDLVAVAAAEAKKAKAKGLRPFLELRADWCEPCRKLDAVASDPAMVDAFDGTSVIRVDTDLPGLNRGPFHTGAIPVFFELADDGKPTGRTLDGGAWRGSTPSAMAAPLKKFFHPS
jgi:hypothetical protein